MPLFRAKTILRVLIVAGIIVLLYSVLFYSKIGPGDDVPEFSTTSINGKVFKSSELHAPLSLVHFWAHWCAVCIPELGELNKLKSVMGADLDIVAIHEGATEKDAKVVTTLIRSRDLNFDVYLDSGNISDLFGIKMYPESFLVGKNGIILEKLIGAIEWTDPKQLDAIRKMVQEGGLQ
jgi:thiol-disulfide isomerase/thioredoxin